MEWIIIVSIFALGMAFCLGYYVGTVDERRRWVKDIKEDREGSAT